MPSEKWTYLFLIHIIISQAPSHAKVFHDILNQGEKGVFDLTADELSVGHLVRHRRQAQPPNNNNNKPVLNLTSTELLDKNHNQAVIHWSGDNSDTIFVLTREVLPNSTVADSKLWRSNDYGSKFTPVDLEDNAVIRFFQTSPVNNNNLVFTDVKNKQIYWTDDEGVTLHPVLVGFEPDIIQFHPTQDKQLYGYSYADRQLRVSTNLGRKWSSVRTYVNPRLFWGDTTQGDSDSTIHMEVQDPLTGRYKYLMCEEPYTDSDCKDRTGESGVSHTDMDSLLVYKEYIFVQQSSPFSTHLFVSYKHGPFKRAYFPANLHPQDFNVVNADEGQVFIAANHIESSVSLYLSDPTGRFYILSIERVVALRQRSGLFDADLYEVQGLKGTYIVNQLTDDDPRTLITYNQGGQWNVIPAPDTDSNGAATNCKQPSCSLHLHLKYSYRVYGRSPILSEANAPGIIMAQGVIGKGLNPLSSTFYLSTNGGLTWTEEFPGDYSHTILDQGAAMVLIEPIQKILKYSVTMGKEWLSQPLTVSNIRIVGVLSEPGISTRILSIFGHIEKGDNTGWIIIKVDMTSILSVQCVDSDYKDWSPTDEMTKHDCLLGRHIVYKRRKEDSECFNGPKFQTQPEEKPCTVCLPEDYECDFGYERDGAKCKVATWFNPDIPLDDCPEGGHFSKSKGYRKVASDLCGADNATIKNYGKVQRPCPIVAPGNLQLYAQTSNMVAIGKPITVYLQQEVGSKLNTNYTWVFGNDTTTKESSISYAANANKTHVFSKPGVQKVTVTASNKNGNVSTSLDILVRASITNMYLDTPHGGQAKKSVQFEVFPESSQFAEDNSDLGNVHYIWFFGDETDETAHGYATWLTAVNHVYKTAGNYTVRVEASNTVSSHFQTYNLVLYGTLSTVQLTFSQNAQRMYQDSVAWRIYFADILKGVLMQALDVVQERLEVVVLRGQRSLVADVSILPQQQLATQDDSIKKLVAKLKSLVQQDKLAINSSVYHLPLDGQVTVETAVIVTADSGSHTDGNPSKNNYTAVYVCVPIVFVAVFLSVLVMMYYKKKFSNIRRYQLLRSHSQAADRLLDDTDDDDPLLEPNPDLSVDRRLALSDDNSDDPLAARYVTTSDGSSRATVTC